MAATVARPRVDEQALGAGTTVRFWLLLVLLLVSSASMVLDVSTGFTDSNGYGCVLAAGGDPNQGTSLTSVTSLLSNDEAYQACEDRYALSRPWWLAMVWPALLVAAACGLFWGLPAWRVRRGRVVPLAEVDDGEILRTLEGLAAEAGLARVPHIVVDPAATSTGAVVFGSTSRPTVCLHGGLLAGRRTDPGRFRAVLLHEFAHIRNGDVTLTYATVALWRVFFVVVLLPYVAWWVAAIPEGMQSPFWPAESPLVIRNLVLAACMVVLVYLARSDVLRSREIYADLAAAGWGADLQGSSGPTACPASGPATNTAGGAFRRTLGAFVELWRTHPRWDLRREALTDPAVLVGVRALPMFLTGTAATLINAQLTSLSPSDLSQSEPGNQWMGPVAALTAAGVVTAVAGIALWRAVVHAVLAARPVPSGVRAGLWLGAGMATGELAVSRVAVVEWLPGRPLTLILVVLVGAVFAWWTTQCSHLWARAWPGRTIRPAMLICLATAGFAMSAWFTWWHDNGVQYAVSQGFASDVMRQVLEQTFPGPAAEHSVELAAISEVWLVVSGMSTPLILAAVTVLWVVPLLAWTVRRTAGALPPLRLALLPGLLGGIAGWIGVAGAMAYLHTWQPPPGQRAGLYALIFLAWTLVALVAGLIVAAVAAAAWARRAGPPREGLLMALIAAETAALVGIVGRFVLASFDGCIPPLNTMASFCHWNPAAAWPLVEVQLGYLLPLGAIAAVIGAVVGSALRRVARPLARLGRGHPTADRNPPGKGWGGLAARRLCVGVLCAAAVGFTATRPVDRTVDETPFTFTTADVQGSVERPAVSARIKALQVSAWYEYGGSDLVRRHRSTYLRLADILRVAGDAGTGVETAGLRPLCADIGHIARDAERYFPVPDPEAQALWRTYIAKIREGGKDCLHALDQVDEERFIAAMKQLIEAGHPLGSVRARIEAVIQAGAN